MITPATPIEKMPRVGMSLAKKLNRLGIKTAGDLLFHFPSRYEDFSNQKPIKETELDETVTISGVIKRISNARTARKRMFITEAVVEDQTGRIKAVWFNQPFLLRNLKMGSTVSLSGKIAFGPKGKYLQNPSYEKIGNWNLKIENYDGIHTGGLIPIYPETEGITSRWIRFLIKTTMNFLPNLAETLPDQTMRRHNLWDISKSIQAIHFPKSYNEIEKAGKRFGFEEMLMIQLRVIRERMKLKESRSPEIKLNVDLVKSFLDSLPFKLTDAQRRALWEIMQDISKPRPMNRLLEGDVGSGKTIVAAATSLLVSKAGYQVAYLAPTEILANQHFLTFQKILSSFGISVGLCTAFHKKCVLLGRELEKPPIDRLAESGELNILIGTHTLIQNKMKFKNLGLVIVDEQHRFGVEQRAGLLKKGLANDSIPHFLSMTATPIPRTLALTVFGDLDISLINELPKDRKEIITEVIEPKKRQGAYGFIREEVKRGRQAFVICPRIETSDKRHGTKILQQKLLMAEVKAVKDECKKLAGEIFPDLKVAMLHGKMPAKEKEEIMKKFSGIDGNHEIDILVSTSVVEVGVDIPNATIMMIEGAERFGLSQLHQFRGRIGRGEHQSYCFLFTTNGEVARRLKAIQQAKTGFELAEKDLEIRGPGDIFGTRQSGIPDIVLKNLNDHRLVRDTRQEAILLLSNDPTLKIYPRLLKKLEEMQKTVHWE